MKRMMLMGLAVFCSVAACADMAPLPRHDRTAALHLTKEAPLTVSVNGPAGHAVIDLLGGRILSWKTASGSELLFMPRRTESPDGDWSHGGISVCWPWFGKKGDKASSIHGFARNRRFTVRNRGLLECGGSFVTLGLSLAADENPDFPFASDLELTFRMTSRLEMVMRTKNTGEKPFAFSEGIQPYFAVSRYGAVTLRGVKENDFMAVNGMDAAFPRRGDGFALRDADANRELRMYASGNTGVVVWSPGNVEPHNRNLEAGDTERFIGLGPSCRTKEGTLMLAPGQTHELVFRTEISASTAYGAMRLLYWNIQDGMWDGQGDNFNRFVEWVQKLSPDICVFAEVKTKRQTGKFDSVRDESQRILPKGWPELAARYGHNHVWISSDNPKCYMQGITSRFPIEGVAKDLVPTGSGWAKVRVGANVVNIVTVHLNWAPWGHGCKTEAERKASAAKFGGELARRDEIETVLRKSFFTVPDASNQFWVVAGDYNARSPVDGRMYDLPPDSPRYAVHRWLAESTPLVDALHEWLPNDFHVTCGAKARIDYVYLTRSLYDRMTEIRVVVDRYTRPTYTGVSDIWRPSDHRPILVDFDF